MGLKSLQNCWPGKLRPNIVSLMCRIYFPRIYSIISPLELVSSCDTWKKNYLFNSSQLQLFNDQKKKTKCLPLSISASPKQPAFVAITCSSSELPCDNVFQCKSAYWLLNYQNSEKSINPSYNKITMISDYFKIRT